MMNVTIHDNGSAYMISVNGLTVKACTSLGNAWRHIEWMYKVASQKFTVGKNEIPVVEWLNNMYYMGFMDGTRIEDIEEVMKNA